MHNFEQSLEFGTSPPKLTHERQIATWLRSMGIHDYHIEKGIVDVNGDVILHGKLGRLESLPVQFGVVTGIFDISNNQLKDLFGAPREAASIYCDDNCLKSLEGGPEIVKKYYNCSCNMLRSLKWAPRELGYLFATNNLLERFDGPEVVRKSLDVSDNPLPSMVGCPHGMSELTIPHTLKSLEGMPDGIAQISVRNENGELVPLETSKVIAVEEEFGRDQRITELLEEDGEKPFSL